MHTGVQKLNLRLNKLVVLADDAVQNPFDIGIADFLEDLVVVYEVVVVAFGKFLDRFEDASLSLETQELLEVDIQIVVGTKYAVLVAQLGQRRSEL